MQHSPVNCQTARPPRIPDLDNLAALVHDAMTPASLSAALPADATQVERLACDWMAVGGKRWRPLLTVAAYAALCPGAEAADAIPAALAVEALHKASLIHDDIEDGDNIRYGRPTLHAAHGIPIAINVGDFLIGDGYGRLLEMPLPSDTKERMLLAIADGHRALCRGQGEELAYSARPGQLSLKAYLDICTYKTGAAFEVALLVGAIQGGAGEAVCVPLRNYSRALGIAYQIGDDLEDIMAPGGGGDLRCHRPTILLALACESGSPEIAAALAAHWARPDGSAPDCRLVAIMRGAGLHALARQHAARHLQSAESALGELCQTGLARTLRQVAQRLVMARE